MKVWIFIVLDKLAREF